MDRHYRRFAHHHIVSPLYTWVLIEKTDVTAITKWSISGCEKATPGNARHPHLLTQVTSGEQKPFSAIGRKLGRFCTNRRRVAIFSHNG
jgi:hypothetical protein